MNVGDYCTTRGLKARQRHGLLGVVGVQVVGVVVVVVEEVEVEVVVVVVVGYGVGQ